jgi:hypothetical protein
MAIDFILIITEKKVSSLFLIGTPFFAFLLNVSNLLFILIRISLEEFSRISQKFKRTIQSAS